MLSMANGYERRMLSLWRGLELVLANGDGNQAGITALRTFGCICIEYGMGIASIWARYHRDI